MKKLIALLIAVCLVFCSCAKSSEDELLNAEDYNSADVFSRSEKVNGIFMSYLDLTNILTGRTLENYRANLETVFSNLRSLNINTVFFQVRPFSDALYTSTVYPVSRYVTGDYAKTLPYDPLQEFITMAAQDSITVFAWVNPYRIANANSGEYNSTFCDFLRSQDERSVIDFNDSVYLNPANATVQKMVVAGVEELVNNYDIAGVIFDDYFYPTTEASFDKTDYDAYVTGGGTLDLASWRRENVSTLVSAVYSAIKSADANKLFGVSPSGVIATNINNDYADVNTWCSEKGYIDFIIPQVYYGFDNTAQPFAATVEQWQAIITEDSVNMLVALAVYKAGTEDSYAGDAGLSEWTSNTDIIARQYTAMMDDDNCAGVVYFRYGSFFNPAEDVAASAMAELDNLQQVIE